MQKVTDAVTEDLEELLAGFTRRGVATSNIEGSINVGDGHSYWWFLEYGTASHFGAYGEPDGSLQIPRKSAGKAAGANLVDGLYPIRARRKKFLRFKRYGRRWKLKSVMHPGIKPVGMVRLSMRSFGKRMERDLEQLQTSSRHPRDEAGRFRKRASSDLPSRKQLLSVVNTNLLLMLRDVQARTPVNPEKSRDLRSAWDITLAE